MEGVLCILGCILSSYRVFIRYFNPIWCIDDIMEGILSGIAYAVKAASHHEKLAKWYSLVILLVN